MLLINKFNCYILICLCYNILLLTCLPTISDNKIVDDNRKYVSFKEFNEFKEKFYEKLRQSDEFILRYNHGDNMVKNMNLSVDPCDNFYEYACGNWENYNPIPKDESENQIFTILREKINIFLKKSLTESESLSHVEKIAKLFYSSCVDVEKIKERSTEPLLNFIKETGGWPVLNDNWSEENFDLMKLLVSQQKYGLASFLTLTTEFDMYNSTNYVPTMEKTRNGLEDIGNLNTEKDFNAYSNLISQILKILGVEEEKAKKTAEEIANYELEITNIADEYNDIFDFFIPTTLSEIIESYPDFNWNKYFNSAYNKEIDSNQKVILHGITDIKKIFAFINNSNKRILHNYIAWQNVYQIIDALDERFIHEKNVFFKTLNGKEESERSKRCVEITSKKLGWLTSSIFIKANDDFDSSAKTELISIIEEIRNEFLETIKDLDWVDDETKKLAELKVTSTKLLIGYPEFVINEHQLVKYYENLQPLQKEHYFENYLKLKQHEVLKTHEHLNNQVDREEWLSHPIVVDAFFHPVTNVIMLPSGILQLPLYHKHLPKALKYAAIGSSIGHEFTHGFDTTGRLFDHAGNLKSWWSQESIDYFTEKSECFEDQYSNFSMFGTELSGGLSNKENIADNGGIRQAFSIYKKWLNKASPDEILKERLPNVNLTDIKLFYLGYAQTWCSSIRAEAIQQKLQNDRHPPGKFRVLGALHNSEDFSETFNCPVGSLMNPIEKCRLW